MRNKGMALFPRKVDGRYAMLVRQDNENIWFLQSDDMFAWNGGVKVVEPRFPWEFVQMGNCGSPIEVDEGRLVFTHGVGKVRNYAMGAVLLDKANPSLLLARTPLPMLGPTPISGTGMFRMSSIAAVHWPSAGICCCAMLRRTVSPPSQPPRSMLCCV